MRALEQEYTHVRVLEQGYSGVAAILTVCGIMTVLILGNLVLVWYTRSLQFKVMELKDQRIRLMSEVLAGIKVRDGARKEDLELFVERTSFSLKVLKLYGWEKSFEQKILEARKKEMKVVRQIAVLNSLFVFNMNFLPFLMTLAAFAMHILSDQNNQLDASKAFVCVSLFDIIRIPLTSLPSLIFNLIQVQVSLQRIDAFMNQTEVNADNVLQGSSGDPPILVQNASFTWEPQQRITHLYNLNFMVPHGALVGVVGPVGAGKSSLLSALVGDVDKISGSVRVTGVISYLPQIPWMQNASIRDNILFGKPFDAGFYRQVIEACALSLDFH
ncbi:unnamed protein product, partial [Cyprideis torosa]